MGNFVERCLFLLSVKWFCSVSECLSLSSMRAETLVLTVVPRVLAMDAFPKCFSDVWVNESAVVKEGVRVRRLAGRNAVGENIVPAHWLLNSELGISLGDKNMQVCLLGALSGLCGIFHYRGAAWCFQELWWGRWSPDRLYLPDWVWGLNKCCAGKLGWALGSGMLQNASQSLSSHVDLVDLTLTCPLPHL